MKLLQKFDSTFFETQCIYFSSAFVYKRISVPIYESFWLENNFIFISILSLSRFLSFQRFCWCACTTTLQFPLTITVTGEIYTITTKITEKKTQEQIEFHCNYQKWPDGRNTLATAHQDSELN